MFLGAKTRIVLSRITPFVILVVFVFSSFSTLIAEAAFNEQINYQGKLTDLSNVAVPDGSYSMTFRLYTVASGGSAVWTESRSVTVTNGLFSVMLGSVSSLSSVDFDQTLYLGVTVSPDSEMSPRNVLGAVPAAMVAKKLGSQTAADFLRSNGADEYKAGNTLTVSGDIDSNGNVSFADTDITFDGASTNVTTTGNFSLNTNQLFVNKSTGNIGIGTSNLLAPLTVGNRNVNNSVDAVVVVSRNVDDGLTGNGHAFSDSSNIFRSGTMSYNSFDARVNFTGTNDFGHYAAFQSGPIYSSSGQMDDMYNYTSNPSVSAGTVSRMYGFYAANPTGAGAVNYNYGLYVPNLTKGSIRNYAIYTAGATRSAFMGGINTGNILIAPNISTGPAAQLLEVQGPAASDSKIRIRQLLQNYWDIGLATSSPHLTFSDSSGDKLIIKNTGEFGIGTTTPSYKLDIDGGTGITARFSGRVIGGNAVNSNEFITLSQLTASTSNAFINNGNSFGGLTTLGTNDNYDLLFETNGSERMRIGNTGKIGIGAPNITNSTFSVYDSIGNNIVAYFDNAASEGGYLGTIGNFAADEFGLYDASGDVPLALFSPNEGKLYYGYNGITIDDGLARVGIGTTTPSYKLDIDGGTGITARFSGRVIGGNAVNSDEFVTLSQLTASTSNAFINNGNSFSGLTTLGTNDNNALAFETNGTEKVRILANGNVGIGTLTPLATLHIQTATSTFMLGNPNVTATAGFAIDQDSSGNYQLRLRNSGNFYNIIRQNGYRTAFLYGHDTSIRADVELRSLFATDIRSYNNFIVGTISDGNLKVGGGTGTTPLTVRMPSTGGFGTEWMSNDETTRLAYISRTGAFYGTDEVRISGTAPTLNLYNGGTQYGQLFGTASGPVIRGTTSDNLARFYPGNTYFNNSLFYFRNVAETVVGLTVDNVNGRIGIGKTTTPLYAVDAVGDISASGRYHIGGQQIAYRWTGNTLNSLFFGNGGGSLSYTSGTDGAGNTGLGIDSLLVTSTGYYNTGGGYRALYQTNTGSYNTAFGALTLNANTSGFQNTAIGGTSLNNNQTGSLNTAVGYQAGYSASGNSISGNSLFGYRAGLGLLTGGNNNTFIGYQAGHTVTTGANNIAIGYNAAVASATGSNQLSIGNVIYGNLSTGFISIGTTTPSYKLDIDGGTGITARFSGRVIGGNAVNSNEFTTLSQLSAATSSLSSTYFAQNGNSFGALTTLGTNDNNALAFETNNIERMRIDTSGNVGIGTSTPSHALSVKSSGAGAFKFFDGNGSILEDDGQWTYFKKWGGSTGIAIDRDSGFISINKDSDALYGLEIGGTTAVFGGSLKFINTNETELEPIMTGGFKFNVDSTEQIRITADGKLGIGTSTPQSKLTVFGDIIAEGNSRYLNFGSVSGVSGYGLRDNAGVLQYKHSGGSWTDFTQTGTGVINATDLFRFSHFDNNSNSSVDPFAGFAISSGTIQSPNAASVSSKYSSPLKLRSSTTINGGYRFQTNTTSYQVGDNNYFEAIMQNLGASTATIRLGYHDTSTSADAVDGVYFEITGGTTVRGKTSNNSARSTTASSYTTPTGGLDYLRYTITLNSSATLATFRIYNDAGTLVWSDSLSTNIPNTSARLTGVGLVATESSTTATDMVHLEYMGFGTVSGYNAAVSDGGGVWTKDGTNVFYNGGSVGLGTSTPTAQLHTTGTVRFSNFGAGTLQTDANGNVSVSSDEQLKNIQGEYTRGLKDIVGLKPIAYHWKSETGYDTVNTYYGFSAQNVEAYIPEAVATDPRGYLTLSDRPLLAASVNAIKELDLRLSDIEARIGMNASSTPSTSSNGSFFGNIASSFETFIENGRTIFSSFFTRMITLVEKDNEVNPTGEGVIRAGETSVRIDNDLVTPTSRIIITFTSPQHGAEWYVSEKQDNSFVVSLDDDVSNDITFDYMIIGVDRSARTGYSSPESSPGGTQNMPPTPEPQPAPSEPDTPTPTPLIPTPTDTPTESPPESEAPEPQPAPSEPNPEPSEPDTPEPAPDPQPIPSEPML